MGTLPTAMIKPPSCVLCKFQTAWGKIRLLIRYSCWLLLTAGVAVAADGVYESWQSESFSLGVRESFQLKVDFDQIQVRSWKLVVDGGDQNCDLHVLRMKDESLVYQLNDQRHHEVTIPWGQGEEVSIVITNRAVAGNFVVSLMGPPRDQVQAAYSYHVNRSLEKFGGGQRLAAEDECRKALLAEPTDGVAKVLLAGFLRDRHYFDRASSLVDEALTGDLPEGMKALAESMREELIRLRAPLPTPVRNGVTEAEDHLIAGEPEQALTVCDKLLSGDLELDSASRSRVMTLRGRALDQLGRNFEAIDDFTHALQLSRTKAAEGVIYFHMGRLFMKMENLLQAQGAFTMSLQSGLPTGLDVVARESLLTIENQLDNQR